MTQERHSSDRVVPFSELVKQLEPLAGGKGRSLARMYRAGYRVPDGFIILPAAFVGDELTSEAWAQTQMCLSRLRRADEDGSFAVRSSALSEDSAQASFAGEFETVLDVRTDEEICAAIRTVRCSRHNARVQAYTQAQGLEQTDQEIAVVVQRLIRPDYAGVLFTVDPVTGDLMRMTGNFVPGLGEKLVSGQANAQTFTLAAPERHIQRTAGTQSCGARSLSQRLRAGERTRRPARHRMGSRRRAIVYAAIAAHHDLARIQSRDWRVER